MLRLPVRCSGYTLIELLAVIAILGLVAVAAALSVSASEARQWHEEARRLGALFRIAQDEARISGRPLIWEADAAGYRFRPLDAEAGDLRDDAMRARAWPFAVRRVEGGRILFGREPLLVATRVRILTADREVSLQLDPLGNLRVTE